ncbi:MAG: SH3 domain-containing protein [Cyanobacteria bacterium P01_G01_bin.19]
MTKSNILQRVSATAQFILGFLIGISLIVGVTGSLVFIYYKRMSVLPQKPQFSTPPTAISEEVESATTIEPLESNTTIGEEKEIAISPQEERVEVESEPELEPELEPEPEPELQLPANSYYATVTWPEGLSLRAEPSVDAERVGGIEYNSKIVILENSNDGNWQRVLLPWNQQEGWVKAGNVKKV